MQEQVTLISGYPISTCPSEDRKQLSLQNVAKSTEAKSLVVASVSELFVAAQRKKANLGFACTF